MRTSRVSATATPADLVQQALAPWYASPGTVADTEQLHTVSDTVADTGSPIVTATVTDTLRKELPLLVVWSLRSYGYRVLFLQQPL